MRIKDLQKVSLAMHQISHSSFNFGCADIAVITKYNWIH